VFVKLRQLDCGFGMELEWNPEVINRRLHSRERNDKDRTGSNIQIKISGTFTYIVQIPDPEL
jgi:hypothetical protein